MSEKSDREGETSFSSSDDDDDVVINSELEKDFLKTLSCLKSKDPIIYDTKMTFFKEDYVEKEKSKEVKAKPVYIKDYENRIDSADEEEGTTRTAQVTTKASLDKAIKDEFKDFLNDNDGNEEGYGGLFQVKQKPAEEKEKEQESYVLWLKGQKDYPDDDEFAFMSQPLRKYWTQPNLDEKEQFLKDFILNKKFLSKDDNGSEHDLDTISQDERDLAVQEHHEQTYNFRFENEAPTEITRYPRHVHTSVRRKDEKRKRKRKERQERKKKEKEKKHRELKVKQKLKLQEIRQRLDQLKHLTGNDSLGFTNEEILGDFDSEVHDKKMSDIFSEKFYEGEEAEKPVFHDEDEALGDSHGEDINDYSDNFNMDCEAAEEPQKSKRTRREKKKQKRRFNDVVSAEIPLFDSSKHASFKQYLDEFYSIDCEDFIEDIPCKFKYREVQSNDFGLSLEEILMADDKELDRWCSLKKIQKLRPAYVEKNEVKIYREKANDIQLKRKILPSLFPREEDESDPDFNTEGEKHLHENIAAERKPPQLYNQSHRSSSREKETRKRIKRKSNLELEFESSQEQDLIQTKSQSSKITRRQEPSGNNESQHVNEMAPGYGTTCEGSPIMKDQNIYRNKLALKKNRMMNKTSRGTCKPLSKGNGIHCKGNCHDKDSTIAMPTSRLKAYGISRKKYFK